MEDLTVEKIIEMGYESPRKLPDGRWLAINRMAYTTGLFVKLDYYGYHHRFCYGSESDARRAVESWDGNGFPPGPWIKRKGIGEDLSNPNINNTVTTDS